MASGGPSPCELRIFPRLDRGRVRDVAMSGPKAPFKNVEPLQKIFLATYQNDVLTGMYDSKIIFENGSYHFRSSFVNDFNWF